MKFEINYSHKDIKDIEAGDLVISSDGKNNIFKPVVEKFEPVIPIYEQMEVTTEKSKFICSLSHRMHTNKGYMTLHSIMKEEDIYLTNSDGNNIKILNVETIGTHNQTFYDLHIDETHCYYIGNIDNELLLSHNSATVHVPFWHYEIEDILQLKNNAGTDDNRVRKLDYSIQFCKLFYERLIKNEDITLFSPAEAKGLYDSFGDNSSFEELYIKYEKSKNLLFKKKIPAKKLAEIYARERLETGRIYSMNIDNANLHSSWDVPIKMSNLCQEILHPTKPIKNIDDTDGEIGICMLSAINLLEVNGDEDIQVACSSAVRSLNSVIDYQDYPVVAGENFTKNRRSLGIGITNLAGFLAKNKVFYHDKEALRLVHETMEKIQWHLLNESCKLAEEDGACPKFNETKYAKGLLPIDWYKKTVDTIVEPVYVMDWEDLRERISKFGLRNSTLSAIMPCESSSLIQNSTNGIEPVRSLLSYKKAKNGVLKQLVPNYSTRKNYYTKAWTISDNTAIINIASVIQKFTDMSISLNLYYNYANYEDGNIPLSTIIKDQIYCYKMGIKNLYYCNTPDGDGETEKKSGCDSGACSI